MIFAYLKFRIKNRYFSFIFYKLRFQLYYLNGKKSIKTGKYCVPRDNLHGIRK